MHHRSGLARDVGPLLAQVVAHRVDVVHAQRDVSVAVTEVVGGVVPVVGELDLRMESVIIDDGDEESANLSLLGSFDAIAREEN